MADYDADIYGEGMGTAAAIGQAARPDVKAAAASARAAAGSLKDAAQAAVDEVRGRLGAVSRQAVDQAQGRYGDLEAWVIENPARALGVAAGVGVVLGLLLRGRRQRVAYARPR